MHTLLEFRFDANKNTIDFDYQMAKVEGNVYHKTFIDDYRASAVGNLPSVCEGVNSFGLSAVKPSWIQVYPNTEFPGDLAGAYIYMLIRVGAAYHSKRTSNNIRPAQLSVRLKHAGKQYSFNTSLHVSVSGNVKSTALPTIAMGGLLNKRSNVSFGPGRKEATAGVY